MAKKNQATSLSSFSTFSTPLTNDVVWDGTGRDGRCFAAKCRDFSLSLSIHASLRLRVVVSIARCWINVLGQVFYNCSTWGDCGPSSIWPLGPTHFMNWMTFIIRYKFVRTKMRPINCWIFLNFLEFQLRMQFYEFPWCFIVLKSSFPQFMRNGLRTHGRTNGPTDQRTNGPTDGRTKPLIEMRGRI